LVTSRGFGFVVGDVLVLGALSEPAAPARASDAAVGAVSELLLGFFTGALSEGDNVEAEFEVETFAEVGVLGWLAGDFTALEDALGGAFVEIAAGLPFVVGFFVSIFLPAVVDLKSSATGASASPPLTASSLEGSAGFISLDSCSLVTGLSGFSGGMSCPNRPSPGFLLGVAATLPAALSTAPSGTKRWPCCSLTVLFKSLNAPSPSTSLKLPLLNPAVPWLSAVAVAMPPANSTGTKLARTLLLGLLPFSLSLPPIPLGLLPLESGELESREALFSKRLRKLRTAEEARFSEDMAAVARRGSVHAFWLSICM
jgi:hypothetical protein